MQDFKHRTFLFAVAVGRLIVDLPNNAVNKVYFNQLANRHRPLELITEPQSGQNLMQILLTN